MVNSWSLLYDELYGDDGMSEKNETKNDNNKDSNSDTIVFGNTTIAGGEGSDILEIHGAGDYFPGKYDYYDDRGPGVVFPTPSSPDRPDQDFWKEDGISLTGNPTACADTISFGNSAVVGSRIPGGMGQDHISLYNDPYPTLGNIKPKPSIHKPGVHKYEEDKGMEDLKDYVASTYSGHYTTKGSNVQTLDLIESVGDAESFCRSNAIKYLSRYDKKGQAKRDILKAMHYCLLLYYFSGNTQNEITTRGYETF